MLRRGSITKTGNAHARRLLTEAAWSYRFPARLSRNLRERSNSVPEAVRNRPVADPVPGAPHLQVVQPAAEVRAVHALTRAREEHEVDHVAEMVVLAGGGHAAAAVEVEGEVEMGGHGVCSMTT